MTRRELIASGLALTLPRSRRYTFHVLGLLQPRKLVIWAHPPGRLLVRTSHGSQFLEGSQSLAITSADTPAAATGRDGEPCDMIIEVPGLFRRQYRGTLRIDASGQMLLPFLKIDLETAVSSITGAEMPLSGAPPQALTAQAVVARSFLIASAPRHIGYDFCDTTHCQFLRSPAIIDSPVDHAIRQTTGLSLQNHGTTIPCRYSAACGGHTDQREELGYRYQAVECDGCLLNHYVRRGHGLGLCQEGAIHLARKGWNYERILGFYLPGARLGPAELTRRQDQSGAVCRG